MIQEEYVSFEVAKLLKEKGFPQKQENSGYYATEMVYCTTESKDGTHHFCHQYPACCDKKYEYICAPTHQMAMRWLREVHKIDIVIFHEILERSFYWCRVEKHPHTLYQQNTEYATYEDAIDKGIEWILENLV